MKEEIYKNYNILADEITQISDNIYEFWSNNKKYVVVKDTYNAIKINQGYNISKYLKEKWGIESLIMIPPFDNSNNNLVIMENNFITLSLVDLPEIEKYHKTIFYNKKVSINWAKEWGTIIDNIELMLNQKNITDVDLLLCINYFIGMGEIGIALFNAGGDKSHYFTVGHQKINNEKYCLINPLNYIWDYESRDYAEYVKYKIINNKFKIDDISYLLATKKWTINQWKVWLSRVFFCDDFFTDLANYLKNNDSGIKKYLQIANIYENTIYEIINKISDHFKTPIIYY